MGPFFVCPVFVVYGNAVQCTCLLPTRARQAHRPHRAPGTIAPKFSVSHHVHPVQGQPSARLAVLPLAALAAPRHPSAERAELRRLVKVGVAKRNPWNRRAGCTGAERTGASRPPHGASPPPLPAGHLTPCSAPRSRTTPPLRRRCAVAAPAGSRRSAPGALALAAGVGIRSYLRVPRAPNTCAPIGSLRSASISASSAPTLSPLLARRSMLASASHGIKVSAKGG